MQALILAAGKGTRLRPLTDNKPKPMVELLGKPILEYTIDFLPDEISEVVLVVGYHGDHIKNYFGAQWKGRLITYVEQKEHLGTAHALFTARNALTSDPFLMVLGDNVSRVSLPKSINEKDTYVVYTVPHAEPQRFGVLELSEDGKTLKHIQEKPDVPASNLISTGTMVLSQDIFNYDLVAHATLTEHYMPQLLAQAISNGKKVYVEEQPVWIAVDSHEDIPVAEAALAQLIKQTRLEKNNA